MLNILILGHSYVENLRRLCENWRKPHQWEDPSNCRGKVSVQMHGYSGGHVHTLTSAINSGLFVHYNPHVVIMQIGSNDCSVSKFDERAFETALDELIDACLSRGVTIIFMAVMKRGKPRYCSSDIYNSRREKVNKMMKDKAVCNNSVYYFKPVNVYRKEYEASDGVHFPVLPGSFEKSPQLVY